MNTTTQRTTDAITAARSGDSEAAMRAIGLLATHPPEEVIEELGTRLLSITAIRDIPVEPSHLIPYPAVANRLVEALRAEDIAAVHAAVDHSYARLVTTMVCTLAAIDSPDQPTG